jgi:hypothetical protein
MLKSEEVCQCPYCGSLMEPVEPLQPIPSHMDVVNGITCSKEGLPFLPSAEVSDIRCRTRYGEEE